MRKIRLGIAAMSRPGKQIDGFFLQNRGAAVVVDEKDSLIATIARIALGLAFSLFPSVLFFQIVFLAGVPNLGQYAFGNWLAISILFCAVFFFGSMGLLVAFVRSHVEATSERILVGNTWFGAPVKLKAMPVSAISAIKLTWERGGGPFGSHWHCAVSTLSAKTAKPVQLFSCSTREAALELVNPVAEITKLPVQDVPRP
jgi:hypothetical protein